MKTASGEVKCELDEAGNSTVELKNLRLNQKYYYQAMIQQSGYALDTTSVVSLPFDGLCSGEIKTASTPDLDVKFTIEKLPEIDFKGFTVAQLLENQRHRPMIRPKGGFGDDLEAVAKANQSNLKEKGDWVVLPKVVMDYAEGRFGMDENGTICYRIGETWKKVETVIYNANGQKEPVFI